MEWIGTESAMLQAVPFHADTAGRCQFPGCAAAVPARPKGQRGAPRSYCDNADHTAQKALRLRLKAADRAARPTSPPTAPKPVTDGIATLAALVDRYDQLRTELAAVADDAADVLADLTDPAAIEREINEVRRDAEVRIAAAEQARDDAEKACAAMKLRQNRAVELEALAIDAAEESRAQAEAAQARLGEVEQKANERIAEAEADRDRIYEEAETVLTEMRGHVDTARAHQTRAEAERDTAREQHQAIATENRHLRADLDRDRADYRAQIERRDTEHAEALSAAHAKADRAAREHRDHLTEVLNRHLDSLGPKPEHRSEPAPVGNPE
jgi:chromosome segregation ATPase